MLAMIPVLVLVALLGWQLAAVIGAGLRAQEDVRARALVTAGGSGRVVVVTAAEAVGVVLPGLDGLRVGARIGVRAP
jgi:hypothetical protein